MTSHHNSPDRLPSLTSMRTVRLAGGVALITAIATGCGAMDVSPAADPAKAPLPSDPTMMEFVDPARVDGIDTRTISGTTGTRIHVTYPSLPEAPALTDRLREEVTRQVRAFTGEREETGPTREFNVEWQITALSSDMVGVRLRSGEYGGLNWRNSTRTLWYHQSGKRPLGSAGLLRDREALSTLAGMVKRRLAPRSPQVNVRAIAPTEAMFDSIAFNRHGDLVVEFDDGQVGPVWLGRVAVAVPREEADPLLSTAGRHARLATEEAPRRAWDGPPMRAFAEAPPKAFSNEHGSVDCTRVKCVALTFNDGPGRYTDDVLDVLARHGARATFFALGANAAAQPGSLRRMRDDGHLVANHSWSHRNLSSLGTPTLSEQLSRTQSAVASVAGQVPTLMRPPYGSMGPEVSRVAEKLGLSVVKWNVDTRDLVERDSRAIERRAIDGAAPGAIILMHDVYRPTLDALPGVLTELGKQGYVFVTVPELDGLDAMEPGQTYYAGRTVSPGTEPGMSGTRRTTHSTMSAIH
ncbi:hypothetical protein DP939_03590 [Spongiactinospora rosea]|uniref:NodB homology domain-containing protein n=2 Tax=Spongiactinospora rosea TaxID=2248750 RepID=A0A366M6W0_9ACTN|nr:hypothetical protein DP939_03590 [Spongiactinospora rosea]